MSKDKDGNEIKARAGRIAGLSISVERCNSFAETKVNGNTLTSSDDNNNDGQDKTAEQLLQKSTYVDFNFGIIWKIDDSVGGANLVNNADSDGDGIPDDWEINGLDIDGDGILEVDLKAMGADPNIPDIFVEVDWMVRPEKKLVFLEISPAYSFKPNENIMRRVYSSFKDHGINIHLDVGHDSTDFVTGQKWGTLSGGNEVEYTKCLNVDKGYQTWKNLLDISDARKVVFHHCLFADCLYSDTSNSTSGITPGFGQYFAVTLGGWKAVNDTTIAGTFMHELGHSLGLYHGGCDHENYKPNYLSIMNYAFQTTGLAGTRSLNYSDYVLPEINESDINENTGIDPGGITDGTGLATTLFYHNKAEITTGAISKAAIDFNGNGILETGISLDLNPGGNVYDPPISVLKSHDDWKGINYYSGIIGSGINTEDLPSMNIHEETPINEEKTFEESLDTATLAEDGTGCIELVSSTIIKGVDGQNLYFDIINMGANDATFFVKIQSTIVNGIFSENVTVSGSKTKIETVRICVPVNPDIDIGEYDVSCTLSNSDHDDVQKIFSVNVYEPTQSEIEELQELLQNDNIDNIDPDILSEIKKFLPGGPGGTTFTVELDPVGGSVEPSVLTTNSDGQLNIIPIPFRENFTFSGWFTKISGGEQVTSDTVFTDNCTIYAHWTAIPSAIFTVTFNANDGLVSSTTATTGVNGKLTNLPIPTRSGYAFNGWFTAPVGGTQVTTSTIFTANTTIYAHWTWIQPSTPSFDYGYWNWSLQQLRNRTFTVTATAGVGGTISQVGITSLKYNDSITYTITPNEGYTIKSVTVDGISQGAVTTYTFRGVKASHTISAEFEKIAAEPVAETKPAVEVPAEPVTVEEPTWENPFTDVSETDTYYKAVEFVYENGLFNGVSATEFAPATTMTRAMFVTVLGRLANVDTVAYTAELSFEDVVPGEWYTPYVAWAAENGIVNGYNAAEFGVNEP